MTRDESFKIGDIDTATVDRVDFVLPAFLAAKESAAARVGVSLVALMRTRAHLAIAVDQFAETVGSAQADEQTLGLYGLAGLISVTSADAEIYSAQKRASEKLSVLAVGGLDNAVNAAVDALSIRDFNSSRPLLRAVDEAREAGAGIEQAFAVGVSGVFLMADKHKVIKGKLMEGLKAHPDVAVCHSSLRIEQAGGSGTPAWAEPYVLLLGDISSREAVRALVQLLQDPETPLNLWQKVWDALQGVGWVRVVQACPAVTSFLREVLSTRRRSDLALALGKIGDRTSVAALVRQALDDEDEFYRRDAVSALGLIAAPECEDSIIRATRDSSEMVRVAAVRSLGRYKSDRAIRVLRKLARWSPLIPRRVKEAAREAVKSQASSTAL